MDIIQKTIEFVKEQLKGAEGGHDWFHTERVWKLSQYLQQREGGNRLVIALAALLHDIADPKFHNGDEELALQISENFLNSNHVDRDVVEQVLFIIKHLSFKNRGEAPEVLPLELQIVQDADRLDAIGAIGIARTFNFGGFKNNPMYDPSIPRNLNISKEEYKKYGGTTINHFYEKLLLLRDLMNTGTARILAEHRHQVMLAFLEEFYREWDVDTEGLQ